MNRTIGLGLTLGVAIATVTLAGGILVAQGAVPIATTASAPAPGNASKGNGTPGIPATTLLPRLEAGGGLEAGEVLLGGRKGLLRWAPRTGTSSVLWGEGEVRKILRPSAGPGGWFILGAKGILYTADLLSFEPRNGGLPVKTYKRVVDGTKSFDREVMDLKDLDGDPTGTTLVTCTKDEVWLSVDAGRSWTNLGSPSLTTGLKCVALAPMPGKGEPAVFASHPIKGLYVRKLAPGSPWVAISKGLYIMPTMTSTDEIADLLWVPSTPVAAAAVPAATGAAGNPVATPAAKPAIPAGPALPPPGSLWASNSFQAKVYRGAGAGSEFFQVYDDGREFGTVESLSSLPDGSIRFVQDGKVMRLTSPPAAIPAETPPRSTPTAVGSPATRTAAAVGPATAMVANLDQPATTLVKAAWTILPAEAPNCLAWTEGGATSSLSELWLLAPDPEAAIRREAADKLALYLQAGYIVDPKARAKNFAILADKGLNALVVDLKDDYGRLRYIPGDPLVKSLGRTSNPLDVESLVAEARAKGVWLIARIPVFKDESLSKAAGGKYAVWDGALGKAWQGWRMEKVEVPVSVGPPPSFAGAPPPPPPPPSTQQKLYDERWVDPYSEEVWAYNVALANEILARGFDEVQFDYIRFPTDGVNLGDAVFRWKDQGMDRESAITSFLAFARERIAAPISIDIYGANGWYRSGARTGQDVELIAKYVDVICPMFYPSHFEQGFLAQEPAVERPGRIYRLGSLRNARIARERVIVRPYVQAFYMGVSYDKVWYDPDYVAREVAGVMAGENHGMTFWNNVDRYDDVPRIARLSDGTVVVTSSSAGGGAATAVPAKAAPAGAPAASAGAAAPPQAAPSREAPASAAEAPPIDPGLLD